MKTLKDLVYNILLDQPETRDSDKKLIWKVWWDLDFTTQDVSSYGEITYFSFLKAPSPESCRRVRQQLQREDLLLGKNLIQPTPRVKKERVKLAKEKGASYIMGKEPIFNPETETYEYK